MSSIVEWSFDMQEVHIRPLAFKLCVEVRTNVISERHCNVCLELYLAFYNLHTALTQKMVISDSRAVVHYVEWPYTTCSFRVMHVCTHKMAYWKETMTWVWSHNLADISSRTALTQKRKISNSKVAICSADCWYTPYSF